MSGQATGKDELVARMSQAEEALGALKRGEIDVIIGDKYPLAVLAELIKSEMEKSSSEWQATFDSIPDGICIVDDDQILLRCNKGMAEMFSKSSEEMVGKHCWEVVYGTTQPIADCPFKKMPKTCRAECRELSVNGRWLNLSVYPVISAGEASGKAVHIFQDITTAKELHAKQKQTEAQLQQAQKMAAMGTLAGGIAHDFNNILGAIIGYGEFIQEDAPEESQIRADVTVILAAAKRATDLVQQILTFSRQDANEKQILQPHLVVKEALKMLHATLPTTVTIEENIDPDCGKVLAAPTIIHQIIVNLCTNALQAMAEQKGTLHIELQRRVLSAAEVNERDNVSPGPFVVLTVKDNGCGMEQSTIDRIFEPYFTTKEMGHGTGLGLAIIHGAVEGYNGFIDVESSLGKGSTFFVYFPVTEKSVSNAVAIEKKAREDIILADARILIVDDETLLVRINETRLKSRGYQVTAVTDSLEALTMFRSQPEHFDLLITDQTMPGLTGAELAKAVLEIKPSLPIIMCTGHSEIVSKEEAIALGIKKYVFKPLHGDELLDAVREVLADK